MKHTMRSVLGGAGFAALMLVGLDAAAQSPAPGQGYPAPAPSYPAPSYPAPSYPAPAPGYQAPAQGYQAPAQGYQAPAQGYQAPAQGYQAPAQGYQAPAQAYPPPAAAPVPGYPVQAPGYPPPAPGYGYPPPGYGAPLAPPAPLQWYQSFYFHLGGLLAFHGWGNEAADSGSANRDLSGKFAGGLHLAGYAMPSPTVHVGGYFNLLSGKVGAGGGDQDFSTYTVGLSLKAGGRLAERVWVGFVGDLGFAAICPDHGSNFYGVEISPRIHLDILGLDAGAFKMGAFASFGPEIIPYAAGSEQVSYSSSADVHLYMIYLTLRLGVTFGT